MELGSGRLSDSDAPIRSLSALCRAPNAGAPKSAVAQQVHYASWHDTGCGFAGEMGAEKAGKGRRERLALLGAPGAPCQKAPFCRRFGDEVFTFGCLRGF
jgi:hypothetical protein